MAHLISSGRPIDQARATRALLAWHTADKDSFDGVMDEVIADRYPGAQPGFLFSSFAQTSALLDGLHVGDDAVVDLLRSLIAAFTLRSDGPEGPTAAR